MKYDFKFDKLEANYVKHTLEFKIPGGTSRGVLKTRDVYFLKVYEAKNPDVYGIGECAPLKGLSIDDVDDFEETLSGLCVHMFQIDNFFDQRLANYPSILFGLETALLDLQNGGKRKLFENNFTNGSAGIKINGLIWMGDKEFMLQQIKSKLSQGFTCLKLKIGAINLADELALLKYIRSQFSSKELELRVDANGAFKSETALKQLEQLSKFELHSIEQPIAAGQWKAMSQLCNATPLPIALDEELIGVHGKFNKEELLNVIKPQYIIIKPSLIGGFKSGNEWIQLAEESNIGWWNTSALESNIGLNAIAQWTASHNSSMPQGLGTGQLFTNNIHSPLVINGESLFYDPQNSWDLSLLADV